LSARSFPALALLLPGLGACASDSGTSGPAERRPTIVEWRGQKGEASFALANKSNEALQKKASQAEAPPNLKVVSDEDLGGLIQFMRENRFFEDARSIDPAQLPAESTRGVIIYEVEGQRLVLPQIVGAGRTEEGRESVARFVAIKGELRRVYNEAIGLRIVENRRGEAIFNDPPPNQPKGR